MTTAAQMKRPSVDNMLLALIADVDLRGVAFYIDQNTVMKLTRQRQRNVHKSETFLLTTGTPNFVEREKLATMKKNKVEMPVYEERPWPIKRAATKRTAAKPAAKAPRKAASKARRV